MLDELPFEGKKERPGAVKKAAILLAYLGLAGAYLFVIYKTFIAVGVIKY